MSLTFLLILQCILMWNLPSAQATCGYQTCNLGNEDQLNVHLVPHTHDDVGWLKTVDQYYYGARQTIVQASVQYILDTVISNLLSDPSRRFIYVEIAFFTRWWDEQKDYMKSQVKMLVEQGRLEFILGGWCMNDEAATHYNAIIDQMTLGMTFLNETFGTCGRPRVAWQIDPFGHSREQASLFAQMGFDGLFFGRLDFQDKELREKELRMEEIWRGSVNLDPPHADLFTGVNENGYGPPTGFCFDTYCADQPIMDDRKLEDYNVDEKVDFFVDAAHRQAKHFKTNHIMMTMGSDFQYENAVMWFKNLDKLIKYVNAANKNVTAFYSTPSCYLYALNNANSQWTVKTDDFFPYAEKPHSFWTGYFTSRPGLKGYVRETNKYLQVCNQFEVSSQFGGKSLSASSSTLREAMGVAQHHDAVSGTSKQHVANDYAKRLYVGRKECQSVISEAITGSTSNLHYCDYLNISLCDYSQGMNAFSVIIYNPLARHVSKYIRLPIDCPSSDATVEVQDRTGSNVIVEIVSVNDATKLVRGGRGTADCELLFPADLPALGYTEYTVTKNMNSRNIVRQRTVGKVRKDDITISNEFYKIVFDGTSGLMKTIVNVVSGVSVQLNQQLLWYNASRGNIVSNQQSGAYIFRPNSSNTFTCSPDGRVEARLLEGEGSLVQSVIQKFGDWAYQVVRLYKGKQNIEVEWTVGPIPIKDNWGKEVITRYDTDIASGDYFYTDSNGREVLERKKDYRPTWTLNQSEPVAGNYYPVNSRIFLKDSKTQLTILTDRSQGGASLKDGSLEVMVHRRLLVDDGKGVGEPLNESGQFGNGLISRGKHWLLLDTVATSARQHRLLAEEIFMDSFVAFQGTQTINNTIPVGSLLVSPLPENVHLLTLATARGGGILIRLEHQFEKTDDAELSKPVTVSLKGMFSNFNPTSAEELLLGGNARKDDVQRLQWQAMDSISKRDASNVYQFDRPFVDSNDVTGGLEDQFDVTLEPMQIRTFLLK